MSDIQRILALPEEDYQHESDRLVKKWTENLRRHKNAPPLKPLQALALEVVATQANPRGFLGALGVGTGKTLISMLIPEVAGLERPVLLLDPQGLESAQMERITWSRHYFLRRMEAVPYSQLSSPTCSELLDRLRPDGIIADECHALKSDKAARTKRFLRYMLEHENTRLFAMTGTLSTGSVRDYHHHAALALRDGSPLPFDLATLQHWASVLSDSGKPSGLSWRTIQPVAEWAGVTRAEINAAVKDEDKGPFQKAYAKRFFTTPGVLASTRGSTEAELRIHPFDPPLPKKLLDTIRKMEDDWETPDGAPIVDGMEMSRLRRQLVQGFYYRPDWGDREPDKEWDEARKAWLRESDKWCQYQSFRGCDSRGLLGTRLDEMPKWGRSQASAAFAAWEDWKAVRHIEPPEKEAVWVDATPVVGAMTWAMEMEAKGEKAIVWFQHRAVGEMLQNLGVSVRWEGMPDVRKEPVVALSIPVYHRIWNLQAWGHSLVMHPLSSGDRYEQLVGRTHRQGQMRDVVHLYVTTSSLTHRIAWRKALVNSETIQNLTRNPQKIKNAKIYGHGLAPEV